MSMDHVSKSGALDGLSMDGMRVGLGRERSKEKQRPPIDSLNPTGMTGELGMRARDDDSHR